MVHVVLGMHKSGTTLVSQMLHQSGIAMVEEVDVATGYDDGNQWEREATKAANHALLGSAGRYSLHATGRGRPAADEATAARMRAIVAECSARHADWGFKDPRTCLTYADWARVLPPHRIIVVYRRPEEAWTHYWNSTRGSRRLTVLREFLPRWCEYNAAILAALETTPMPWIVLHYSRLMEDDREFDRLRTFLGRDLSDQRRPDMRRSRPRPSRAYALARGLHRLRGGADPARIVAGLERRCG
jgi:hypothetical protein